MRATKGLLVPLVLVALIVATSSGCASIGERLVNKLTGGAVDRVIDKATGAAAGAIEKTNWTTRSNNGNEEVAKAQEIMNASIDAGLVVDGRWGPKTKAAIVNYQKKNSLPVTGRLDTETKTRMGIQG